MVKGYRGKSHHTFRARVHPEATGLAGGLSPSSTCHLSRSRKQLWSEVRHSAPARPSQCWVGLKPSLGRGRESAGEPDSELGSGQEVHPEEGTTPPQPPLPLPSGTTRHAAAYHPCQPSPPGNVAAFSATPSGVPAAPRHTAAGGGGGSGAGAHPGARRKRQVPLPQRPLRLRWGRGLGKGGGRCSQAPCIRASELLEQAPSGQCHRPLLPPPPTRRLPEAQDFQGLHSCPSPTPKEEASLSSPVGPARETPGNGCLAAARGLAPGSDPPAP